MKKILFVMLALLLVVPAASSYSADIYRGALWSDNRYYDSTNLSEYGMLADTGVSTHAYDVYVYSSSWTPQYHLLEPYVFGGLGAGAFANPADGYPPPGDVYEARDIHFFINEDGSGDYNFNPHITRNYPSGTFSPLSLVQNVNILSAGSDTIVSWDGISDLGFGDQVNDQYRVRIIDKDTDEFLFGSGTIDLLPLNKYAFNLGDISAYGDDLWIGIEARDAIEGQGLVNRSRYYASVPEPATMLLLGSGLIGLVGFRRKKFFKK